MTNHIMNVRETLREARQALSSHRGVVATGVGYKMVGGKPTDELSIICSVVQKQPGSALMSSDIVPATVNGVTTDVVQTGRIRAFQAPTKEFRPAPGGVSIGHYEISAGTLGCLVKRNGETFILSNNHVLANSNNASLGDPILQPGGHDGGTNPASKIAVLEDFVPVEFLSSGPNKDKPSTCKFANIVMNVLNAGAKAVNSQTRVKAVRPQQDQGVNLVDAAIARPLQADDVIDEILNIGTIAGVAEAGLGMSIQKMGRTTGHTLGSIQQIDVTVDVQFGNRAARFTDQVMAGAMSQGGDSGSAVLDDNQQLVGLLFAGSENTTIINRIQHVFSALNVSR